MRAVFLVGQRGSDISMCTGNQLISEHETMFTKHDSLVTSDS
jgi:hypothetical protein